MPGQDQGIELRLTPGDQGRRRLVAALESFAQREQVPAPAVQAIDLALEEHLTNIATHGAQGVGAEILVRLMIAAECLVAEVEDSGPPFNPLDRPEVDVGVPLEQRSIGGLGIHLTRKMTDEQSYRREGGRNIFRMSKRLGAARR
jgi:serine/threonine-protein kinase RsbW